MRIAFTVLPLLTFGCAEWPRFRNLPNDTGGTVAAGSDPRDALAESTSWSELEHTEQSEQPMVALALSEGRNAHGLLDGFGWDGAATPDRVGACGPVEFPPAETGNYLGDVDWLLIRPSDDSTLCVSVQVDAAAGSGASYDLLLYALDACDEPGSLVRDDAGEPLGYGLGGGFNEWSTRVFGDSTYAVALAGFWPDDPNLSAPWTISVASVATGDAATAGACPTPPESR